VTSKLRRLCADTSDASQDSSSCSSLSARVVLSSAVTLIPDSVVFSFAMDPSKSQENGLLV
jgi:hypothetical protein